MVYIASIQFSEEEIAMGFGDTESDAATIAYGCFPKSDRIEIHELENGKILRYGYGPEPRTYVGDLEWTDPEGTTRTIRWGRNSHRWEDVTPSPDINASEPSSFRA